MYKVGLVHLIISHLSQKNKWTKIVGPSKLYMTKI